MLLYKENSDSRQKTIKESCPSEIPLDLKLVMKLAPEIYFCQRM